MAECWRRRAGRNTACSDSVGVLALSPTAAPRVLRKQNPRFCLHGRRGLGGAAGPSLPPWPRQQRPSRPAPLPCGHHGAQGSCGGPSSPFPSRRGGAGGPRHRPLSQWRAASPRFKRRVPANGRAWRAGEGRGRARGRNRRSAGRLFPSAESGARSGPAPAAPRNRLRPGPARAASR